VLFEGLRIKKVTMLGLASGVVAGLVAITPAAGFVSPMSALLIGTIAGGICYGAVLLKSRLHYDDALDAFGVHGIGGILGALLTGVFCFTPVKGLFSGGDLSQFGKQALGVGVAIAFAAGGTFVIASILKPLMGLRTTDQEERDGLDIHVHGERGYHFDQT
jgi:Amt family ammonium transporter